MTSSFQLLTLVRIVGFSLLLECLAAPMLTSQEHTVRLPSSHSSQQQQQQCAHHLQEGQGSEHHLHPVSTHPSTFDQDLDAFLRAWNQNPDVDNLLPWTIYEDTGSPATLNRHSPHPTTSHRALSDLNRSSESHQHKAGSAGLHQNKVEHARLPSQASSHHMQSSVNTQAERQKVSKNEWRQFPTGLPKGVPMKLYKIYASRAGVTRFTAATHLKKSATPEIVDALLSKNSARQNAAVEMVREGNSRLRDGVRKSLLGSKAGDLTRKLADYHGIDYERARAIFNRRLRKEEADLLKNPATFEMGAILLRPHPKDRLLHGKTSAQERLVEQYKASVHDARQPFAPTGGSSECEGANTEKKKRTATSAEEGEGIVEGVAIAKKRYKDAEKARRQVTRMEAAKILPTAPLGKMAVAYKDRYGCYAETANSYIRKAVIEHPEQARQIAAELLSGDSRRIDAIAAKIGIPRSKTILPKYIGSITLPGAVQIQVEEFVMRARKVNRLTAQILIKLHITEELANELQQPHKYPSAIQRLLPLPKPNRGGRKKGSQASVARK